MYEITFDDVATIFLAEAIETQVFGLARGPAQNDVNPFVWADPMYVVVNESGQEARRRALRAGWVYR